jgi:hypothetical protein
MNWLLNIIIMASIYIFGFSSLGILIFLHGCLTTFTKYHIISLLMNSTINMFGFAGLLWIKFCILTFVLIKNYSAIQNQYRTLKSNTLLPEQMNLELINTNIRIIDTCIVINNNIKNYYLTKIYNEPLYDDINYGITKINDCLTNCMNIIYNNVYLLFNLTKNISCLNRFYTKIYEYYEDAIMMYDIWQKQNEKKKESEKDNKMSLEDKKKLLNNMFSSVDTMFKNFPIEQKEMQSNPFNMINNQIMNDLQSLIGTKIGDLPDKKINLKVKSKKN